MTTEPVVPPTPSMADLAADWLDTHQRQQDRDDPGNTLAARRRDLGRWFRAMAIAKGREVPPEGSRPLDATVDGDLVVLDDLTYETLDRALGVLHTHYSNRSLTRLLASLRAFCGWLVRRGYLEVDPSDDPDLTVKVRIEPEVKAFSAPQVSSMLIAAAAPPASARAALGVRDVAIVETMARCGPRASELCALQVGDVALQREAPLLNIRRGVKGGRKREVPLPRSTVSMLERWLDRRRHTGGNLSPTPHSALFLRNNGTPFGRDHLDHLLRTVAARAGVDPPGDAMAHAFRHHFGVQLALAGVPLAVIQQLMGHKDPRTTSVYTRFAGTDLAGALSDAGWL
ncbi:MAG TPA: tyrosine-type recombinase/integrase [Acidimicrobiales bacterium]